MGRRAKPKSLPVIIRRLVHKRKISGLSQAALANKLGCSYVSVYAWETGVTHPSFRSLTDWCSFFNLTLDAREKSYDLDT